MAPAKPKPLTFLVLSDLHFGKLSESADFALPNALPPGIMSGAISMKESLIQVANKEQIGAILVAGDLTSCGSPEEFLGCINIINEIATAIGLSQSNIIYTYGNHDVDWKITSIPGVEPNAVLKELYLKIGASVGDIVLPEVIYSDKGPVPGCGLIDSDSFRIYVVNTGFYSAHDQNYKHGKLGEDQILWLERYLSQPLNEEKWHVLLLHHHPFAYPYPIHVEDISCLEEGAHLIELIGKAGLDFVCHGHRHHPILFTQIRSGWSSPVTMLCAGSFSVGSQQRCSGQIPNLFHIVTLEDRLESGAAVGWVKSFEYSSAVGWKLAKYDNHVQLDAIRKFADVYDTSMLNRDILQVIDGCIGEEDEETYELDSYGNLPLSLQCMPLQDLNRILRQVLLEKNYKVYGEFPDDVIVRRSRNAK